MKILQVNCVYPYGSTGKIMQCLHKEYLRYGHSSIVCYGRGKKIKETGIYKVSSELEAKIHAVQSRLFGVEFSHSPIATNKLIRIIKKESPDVVHLHCLNGNFVNVYSLLAFLKKTHIKTVITLHAEIMHTAGCGHAFDCEKWRTECCDCELIKGKISRYFRDDAKYCFNRMKKAFEGFSNAVVVGVSSWLTDRAKASPIFADCQCITIHNGLNQQTFLYKAKMAQDNGVALPKKKVVLHVTPNFNDPLKGGKFVLELARRMPTIQFIIVGYSENGLELPINVTAIPRTTNQEELANYYSLADITLLTSKRETFSMVCAESLSCGTPIVGFKAGGPETISLPEYSEFVEYGDMDALQKCLERWLDKQDFDKKQISQKAHALYSAENMAANYLKVYKDLFEK